MKYNKMMAMGQKYYLVCLVVLTLLFITGCKKEAGPQEVDAAAAFFLAQAQEAFEQEAFNIALAFTDSANAEAPDLAAVYFMRGRIYTELARFDLADSSYIEALALQDDLQGAWLNRGNLAIRKGALKPALAMYNKEASSYPSASVFLQMGRAYQDLGEPDSARMAFERAIALDDSRATVFMRLGQLLGEQGDFEQAIDYTRQGLALEPENQNYKFALGALLNANGDAEEAVTLLQPFVDASPWHYWGHYNLGQAYRRINDEGKAATYLAKAESLQTTQTELDHWQMMAESNPQHLMLWLRFSYALRRAGNTTDADRADRIAYALAPDYMESSYQDSTLLRGHRKAIIQMARGEVEESVEIYKSLLRQQPNEASLWLNLGVAYATFGRIVQARQCFTTALKYDNQFLRARRYLEDLEKAFYDPEEPGNQS